MKGIILTENQKQLLVGNEFAPSSFYNPTQDKNGYWFISIEEQSQTINPNFLWVKDLEIVDIELNISPDILI